MQNKIRYRAAREKKKYLGLKNFLGCKFLILIMLLSSPGFAQHSIEGEWMLELNGAKAQIGDSIVIGAPIGIRPSIVGKLSLKKLGEKWIGHVEGGPVTVNIEGNSIEILVDSRDLAGFVFIRHLRGEYSDQTMAGTFTIEGATEVPEPGGIWTAVRKLPENINLPPTPVDMTGIWTPAPGMDFRKYSMDLTDKAKLWHKDYINHYDQPNVRCVSPGIVAIVAWGAYPFEVLESNNRLTFLYEVDSEVRRIFMNDKQPPEYYLPSAMGFLMAIGMAVISLSKHNYLKEMLGILEVSQYLKAQKCMKYIV